MKKNVYEKTDSRWGQYPKEKKEKLMVPNEFVNILYEYEKEILGLSEIDFAIETGTYLGETSKILSEHFDSVVTVELFADRNPYNGLDLKKVYDEIKKTHNNIEFRIGENSPNVLKEIFVKNPNRRYMILLDAHDSNQSPLKSELETIRDYSKCNNHVILIDDCKFLGNYNLPTLEEVTGILKEINPNYVIKNTSVGNDVFLIY